MEDRKQEFEVEEMVYWPHPVSGENERSEALVGAGEDDGPEGPINVKRLHGRIFICLF